MAAGQDKNIDHGIGTRSKMNMDLAVSSLQAARSPTASRFPPVRVSERRSQSRRRGDLQQAIMVGLANWLANRHPLSLLVVDSRMTVLLCNESARQVLDRTRAMRIIAGKLVCRSEKNAAELARLLKVEDGGLGSIPIHVGTSIVSMFVDRISLPGGAGNFLALTVSSALDTEKNSSVLREKFGLTRAESQIAMSIFNGTSLVAIARLRKSSINTVKTQARHIFQKCRVNSQAELVRRLSLRF